MTGMSSAISHSYFRFGLWNAQFSHGLLICIIPPIRNIFFVSSYTGITNNNGVAEVTVTGVSAETTFTATYSNATATCTVTVPSYLFYDECNSSTGLTNYGTPILLEGGSSATMEYNSTNNAYKVSNPDSKSKCIPITALTSEDNFVLDADLKRNTNNIGLCISTGTGNEYIISYNATKVMRWLYTNGVWSDAGNNNISSDTSWCHMKLTIQGLNCIIIFTNASNSSVTITFTLPSGYSSTRYIGIGCGSSGNCYIKNIVAESL